MSHVFGGNLKSLRSVRSYAKHNEGDQEEQRGENANDERHKPDREQHRITDQDTDQPRYCNDDQHTQRYHAEGIPQNVAIGDQRDVVLSGQHDRVVGRRAGI
jgi:hypothetical protein